MISMQRSLSSPVRTRSSAVGSPAPTRARSPSPPPNGPKHDEGSRPGRFRSRSPSTIFDSTQQLPLRHTEDNRRRSYQHPQSSSRKTTVARTDWPPITGHQRNVKEQTVAPPVLPPSHPVRHSDHSEPLMQDSNMYTNPPLTKDDESVALQELAHAVRLSKHQERKRANTRIRLQRSLLSTALSARLTRCGDIVHRSLVDCFRKDDKDGFSALYNAMQDVRKSCDEFRRFALLEPDMEPVASPALGSSENLHDPVNPDGGASHMRSTLPFLDELSTESKETLLYFLSEIRTNPDYLASRICALSSSELNAFLSFHKGMETVESVLPFHGRSPNRQQASSANRHHATSDIERLLSFQRHDPLSILIHSCFANSAGPDTSEDQRRTDVWATVLAKLIQQPKSSSEHFLISVLNIWTSMRDWSGKSSMEWYLMKILEGGAFILDRAEDQHGTRFNLSDWNTSDEVAAKDYYDKAVHDLFDLIDDEDATGIPEGLLELGNAILTKLDNKYLENTSRWLVWRCLFFVFLLGVIVHPESYGMLSGYHITPYAREKILKKVAMKAHEYVSGVWSGGKASATCVPADVPPRIKAHVENILARFQGPRSRTSTAKLLPARSITSLRETVEVHPYLVLSPSDLVTLVSALFPERRPMSSMSSSVRSGAPSVSGLSAISQPIVSSAINIASSFETASAISTSYSSNTSDGVAAPREGAYGEHGSATSRNTTPPSADPEAYRRLNHYEDDGYRLRLALHELGQTLGPDTLRGSCHPCAERWMILFLSADSERLSTTATYDIDDEIDLDEASSTTDSDDIQASHEPELDRDYHQLRDAILRLVEEYEIPHNRESEGSSGPRLTNRASRLKRYKSRSKVVTKEQPDRRSRPPNGGREKTHSGVSADKQDIFENNISGQEEPLLVQMLKAAAAQAKAQADFVSSHIYWQTLNRLCSLELSSLRSNGFTALINIFSRGPRDSIRKSAAAIEDYDAWLVWLKQCQERHEGSIDRMMRRTRAMRDKMWFVTDVRHSKEYVHSRNICQALKVMGMPRRWSSLQRSRTNITRGSGSSYLYRSESQIMDLLAATEEQGGPNKLSDEQAEMTTLWLQQYGVENFCQGEERIHRFCCEVDRCISKLVGETIREAPVLWSSELYKREKVVYDRLKTRDGDEHATVFGDNESPLGKRASKPSLFARDTRNQPNTNRSQSPLEASRINFARPTSSLSDVVDGPDYFEKSSPAFTFDSISTFWSPFQQTSSMGSTFSRAYSPTTSLTNLSATFSGPLHHVPLPSNSSISTGRPGTSASSNETVYQRRAEDEKTRFLNELKETLTSLLLSDLGSQVWARGSETDIWFQNLGQQCMDRKDAMDRRARRRLDQKEKEKEVNSRSSTRPRVIEKKKSCGNLREAGENAIERSGDSHMDDDNAAFTTSSKATGISPKRDDPAQFPFKKSYQRLLNMFSVHPSPRAKLDALNELENLIVASLRWNKPKMPKARREDAKLPVNNGTPLADAIGNVRERRSYTLQSGFQNTNTGSQHLQNSSVSTDLITQELQQLFRDSGIRPKSLFRDLQLIASFVSPSVLDKPDRGKAFWNAGLAALKLKSEVCKTMVEMADEVIAAHTLTRKSLANDASSLLDVKPSATGTPPPPSASYKLDDVGKMWTITAKEGYPTAQRELALFYLSNPEFVERTTLPLSRPREVFKQTVMDRYGRSERTRNNMAPVGAAGIANIGVNTRAAGSGTHSFADGQGPSGKDGDVRNDAGLMCVAVHWMEAAEQGGDDLATSFLRQNEFMALS